MSFWDVFIRCLTGAGAMALALLVIFAAVGVLIFVATLVGCWVDDLLTSRRRRK